jgi:FHS family Na+ dependent glucose MFS transporter 1
LTTPNSVAAMPSQRPVRPIASTAAYFAAIMGLGLISASLGPTLLGLAENTHSEVSQMSYLFLARSTGYMLGTLMGGHLIDSKPAHYVMATAIVVICTTIFMVPSVTLLVLLALLLVVVGMSEGTVDVSSNTLLVWVQRDRVGPYMNALHFFFGVGAFLSPILVVQMVAWTGGITWAYRTLALLVVPLALWIALLPSPTHVAAETTETRLASENVLLLVTIAFFMFLTVGAEVTFAGWIYTYAATLGLATVTTAGYLTSVFWGTFTLGRLIGIPAAAVFRPRAILLVDLIGCIASMAVILIWQDQALAVWAGAAGFGLFMATIFATMFLWAERRLDMTGSTARWFFVGASLGSMTLPWLAGQLFGRVGPGSAMATVFVTMVVNLVVFFVLMRVGGAPRSGRVE